MKTIIKIIRLVVPAVVAVLCVLQPLRGIAGPTRTRGEVSSPEVRSVHVPDAIKFPEYRDANSVAQYLVSARPVTTSKRVVVPIYQVVLHNDDIRYWIPITIGHTRLKGMLDTGSTGIRILPGSTHQGDFTATNQKSTYGYGSGVRLKGVIANATVSVGSFRGNTPIHIHAVQTVGCYPNKPNCPASHVSQQDYRIGGDGVSGQGFKAIVGVSLKQAGVVNPLPANGVRTWIIILPKPGDSKPGMLILNPDKADLNGFTTFQIARASGAYDGIPGCLTAVRTNRQICGLTLFDSGKPAITVNLQPNGQRFRFRAGDAARFNFGSSTTLPSMTFSVTARGAAHIRVSPSKNGRQNMIYAGIIPYINYSVFYDSDHEVIGLKSRGATVTGVLSKMHRRKH